MTGIRGDLRTNTKLFVFENSLHLNKSIDELTSMYEARNLFFYKVLLKEWLLTSNAWMDILRILSISTPE